jgi:anthranilate synthase component 1
MELIAELEKEKRGVYAGAVGYFGYGSVDGDKQIEGAMDVSWPLMRQCARCSHG